MGNTRSPDQIDCEDLWSHVYTMHSETLLARYLTSARFSGTYFVHAFVLETSPQDLWLFVSAQRVPVQLYRGQVALTHHPQMVLCNETLSLVLCAA